MFAAARKDTKGMDAFAEVNVQNHADIRFVVLVKELEWQDVQCGNQFNGNLKGLLCKVKPPQKHTASQEFSAP